MKGAAAGTAKRKVAEKKLVPRASRMPKAERRAQLLAVASEIVSSEGTGALTMAALAQRTGVSKPVVYEHFENSEAVTIALLDEYFERVVSGVRENTKNAETLEDYISIVIDVQFDYLASGALSVRNITNGHTSSHATGDKLNAAFNLTRTQSIETFKELLQQQGVAARDAAIAGYVLAEMLSSTAPEFAVIENSDEARKILKVMMLAAIHAISPETKAKPRTPEWILDEADRIRRERED